MFMTNKHGQTGHSTTLGNQRTPRVVRGCLEGKRVVYVDARAHHTACIDEDGDLYTWGDGGDGRLGHGDEVTLSSPKRVDGLVGKKCSSVACGGHHTLVLAGAGSIYSFGHDDEGQLGRGDRENQASPALVEVPLEGKIMKQVACGFAHSMAVSKGRVLYTWGEGSSGALGHGSELNYPIPCIFESLLGNNVVNINSSYAHSVALAEPNEQSHLERA